MITEIKWFDEMKIIDIHTHGISGYDTRTTSPDHILSIAALHGASGISGILLAVYPSSVDTMRTQMETIRKAIGMQKAGFLIQNENVKTENSSLSGVRQQQALKTPLSPGFCMQEGKSARIMGVYLEGPFVNPLKCGALNARYCLNPSLHDFRTLTDGYEDIVKIVTVAPELHGSLRLIRKMTDRGILVNMGHSDATYAEAEAGFHAGAGGLTHLFNAMRGFHHREPGIAGFGLMNRELYIEIIADPHHLHEKTIELIFRTKNPERIIIVSDTVRNSKRTAGKKPVTDKKGKFLGGSMTVAESAERLIKLGYKKDLITRCITKNPQQYLSLCC
jgi:N-acetylglucosamine-6-phosphate deacetylase